MSIILRIMQLAQNNLPFIPYQITVALPGMIIAVSKCSPFGTKKPQISRLYFIPTVLDYFSSLNSLISNVIIVLKEYPGSGGIPIYTREMHIQTLILIYILKFHTSTNENRL